MLTLPSPVWKRRPCLIAHVDVHTGECDACGLTAFRVDGDVVFLRGSRNDGRAVRYSGSASLPDRLPAALGVYGDVALADVPVAASADMGMLTRSSSARSVDTIILPSCVKASFVVLIDRSIPILLIHNNFTRQFGYLQELIRGKSAF